MLAFRKRLFDLLAKGATLPGLVSRAMLPRGVMVTQEILDLSFKVRVLAG